MTHLQDLLDASKGLLRRFLAHKETPPVRDAPRVLALTAVENDQRFFSRLHSTGDWQVTITASVPVAKEMLDTFEYSVVICDREIPGWEWRDLLSLLKSHAPRACFLLSSRVSDAYLWKEVLSHGGYDLLPKPLDVVGTVPILRRAWYYWKSNPPLV